MAIVYLSLGSNLGDRNSYLANAIQSINQSIGKIIKKSTVLETDSIGFKGNSFLNQIIMVETELIPELLLKKSQEIERKLGRLEKTSIENETPIYSNREIDIDILFYDDLHIETKDLTIPHPQIHERDFIKTLLNQLNQ